ncbi:hypothetical protein OH77DRAFT_644849 [Trametes cingulata]|nr:hypothetical protein OH77DRAFT_644849 [Trametes cingulata]
MEHSKLPIELCERIMDVLSPGPPSLGSLSIGQHEIELLQAQHALHALSACALTCRAWRPRAQFVLWTHPQFDDDAVVVAFTQVLRSVSPSFGHHVSTLVLCARPVGFRSLSRPGDVFLLSLPNLRNLCLSSLRFDYLPVPPHMRTRLRLCENVTRLQLVNCEFLAIRIMFNIIWSCPDLRSLGIWRCFIPEESSDDEFARVTQASRHFHACRALTQLQIEIGNRPNIPLHISGGAFGLSLTSLTLIYLMFKFEHVPRLEPFPHLRDLELLIHSGYVSPFHPGEEPFLHELVRNLHAPTRLERISMHTYHRTTRRDCERLFGTADTADPDHVVCSLLPSLRVLEIGLEGSHGSDSLDGLSSCASYVMSVLPSMCDVIVLEDDHGGRIQLRCLHSLDTRTGQSSPSSALALGSHSG